MMSQFDRDNIYHYNVTNIIACIDEHDLMSQCDEYSSNCHENLSKCDENYTMSQRNEHYLTF